MDSQDLRNLQEAYMDVYSELDEQLDDNKRKKLIQYVRDSKKLVKSMRRETEYKNDPEPEGYEPESDKKIKKKTQREQVDIYDIILAHLLDEGYAETPEAAKSIMVNMSEEWRESIVEAKSDYTLKGQEKKEVRNIRTFGKNTSYSKSKATKERHNIHRSKRGIKKIKGDKSQENLASIINQSSRVHKSKNNGYNRDGSYMDD